MEMYRSVSMSPDNKHINSYMSASIMASANL
jgi:hypothetical protein